MSSGSPKRTRANLKVPKSPLLHKLDPLQERDSIVRIALCALAALLLWTFTAGWKPAFSFREGYTPQRNLCARVEFKVVDHQATTEAKIKAGNAIRYYYQNDLGPIGQWRTGLLDRIFKVLAAENYAELDQEAWAEFLEADETEGEPAEEGAQIPLDPERAYNRFVAALQADQDLAKVDEIFESAFLSIRIKGLITNLEHTIEQGNTQEIIVFPKGDPDLSSTVQVEDVHIGQFDNRIHESLQLNARKHFSPQEVADEVALRMSTWLGRKIGPTLTLAVEETEAERTRRKREVKPVYETFKTGAKIGHRLDDDSNTTGFTGGVPLDQDNMELLRAEHAAFVAQMTFGQMATHSLAIFGMYGAMYLLCGFYMFYRSRSQFLDMRQFSTILALAVATICITVLLSRDQWRGELIPIAMFAMTISIAYRHELALILTSVVSLICVFSTNQGFPEFVVMVSTAAAVSFLCGTIRSRTRLVYVGFSAAFITFPTTLGVNIIEGQPLNTNLLVLSAWFGASSIVAGLLMTCLLPFIEKSFDIQTDISLLEIGDASHPLLQELVRRAPGTYNHSINVASISEAAAQSIGANGLLCRVGAYFHDIGKMLKPEYFVENQSGDRNRHDTLNPAMSALVIIAHVKDGVELARQHRLPKRVIDFIEQHHGTTMVEYFYRLAVQQANENGGEVEESTFRYPGPKPRTKEAAVMMLADAVESASRSLVDPAPARIESLVREITKYKLEDRQFDECLLTLKEIHQIEESLIMSLIAMYHGRVKYPDQQTA